MSNSTLARSEFQLPIIKLCECGCGQPAPIARQTNATFGYIKGQPMRFLRGHGTKGRKLPKQSVEERFWKYIDKLDGNNSCWLWVGSKNRHGYGTITVDGKSLLAHRVSWEIHFGAIPSHESYHGLCVLHKCDNPPCVRPDHLFLGTNRDNAIDKIDKNRQAVFAGEHNPRSVLTEKDVKEIRGRCADGERQTDIAREYGVSKYAVWRVIHRKNWAHIP